MTDSGMGQPSVSAVSRAPIAKGDTAARRAYILAAASACFVRAGFHRTSMQDIAQAALMSPANLYRYFASKEDLILGWAAQERERAFAVIAEHADAGGGPAALLGVADAFFLDLPREAAILRMEFWAEMTRNPALADLARRSDAEFVAFFEALIAPLYPGEPDRVRQMLEATRALLHGSVVNRALPLDYDPAPVRARLYDLLGLDAAGVRRSA